MKVVVAFHEPVLGGATLSVLRALPGLEERGWSFACWAPAPSPLHDELQQRGLPAGGAPRHIDYSLRALRLPPGPARRLASVPPYLRAFRRFLEQHRPALVHANSILTLPEALVAKRAGYRALLHVHEMVPQDRRGRLLRAVAWRQLDGVVAVSRSCARLMQRDRAVPQIVYEAAPPADGRAEIRERPRPFRIGTVGVVGRRKGTDLFIEAAATVMRRTENVAFEIVGGATDPLDQRWADEQLARAQALGIVHRHRAHVPERLGEWDAFVLPSRADPFPISMLEAMTFGLPVIGTEVDGIAEQLADGAGILVRPEDPLALADAMLSLLTREPAERQALSDAGRARAKSFGLKRQIAGLDQAYRAGLEAAQ